MPDNELFKLYPLTHPQKRVWYVENIYENTSMHNIGGYLKIKGRVNLKLLVETINILIKKNEALRLKITNKNGEVLQYVKEFEKVEIDYHDFSVYEEPSKEFNRWANEQFRQAFSLESNTLYFFALYKIDENESGIFLKMHHIISDGWSFNIISKEICDIYTSLAKGESINNNMEYSYIDYIENEKKYINSKRFLKDKNFWNEKFTDLPKILPFKSNSIEGKRATYDLSEDKALKIREAIKSYKCSLNTFFISILLIYISKVYQDRDIVLGVPVFNRAGQKNKHTMGMFTSTMPFRYKINTQHTVKQIINDVNTKLMNSFFHQKYPYDLLVQDLGLNKKGHDGLFGVCVNYYNTKLNNELYGINTESVELYNGNQPYSLQIIIKEWSESESLSLDFDYRTNDYSENQIKNMYEQLNNVIDQVLNNNEKKLNELSLLSSEEKEKLQCEFNLTETEYPKEKTIYELFEEQVERTPDRIAISFGEEKVTYKELNEKANQLAKNLRNKGVGRDKIIGLMISHSVEMVVGILATIKSGGAYLPIDPEYPIDRINYMINDAKVSIILTNSEINRNLNYKGQVINLNDSRLYKGETSNLEKINTTRDLVYVIYTSGSTGRPKGVMVEHRGLVNYIWWAKKMYIRNEKEVFALYSSLSFDLTVTSIFTPLISGNEICIYYDDGSEFILYKILRENKVNIIKLTPAHLSLLKDMDNKNSLVKRFIVGGENLKANLAKAIHESFGGSIEIFNEYGPTETVVGCMIYLYDFEKDKMGSVPIGIPGDNVQIYILDKELNIMPYETEGEIYISGDGVARGYLNQNELTTSRFIDNPFLKDRRMYKTGDTAKYRKDGNIEYVGRADNQVKIRGHRIELGEIEEHLLRMEGVCEAVVIVQQDNVKEKKLCGYIVAEDDINMQTITMYLSEFLPRYMIPTYFSMVDKIPLTNNGKIDVSLLPKPININKNKVVPEENINEMEEKLVKVMQEVLNVEKVGIKDSFYEVGGDSIKAIQIASKLNNMGLKIKVKDILSYNVIEEIASCIETNSELEIADQNCCDGEIGETPISMWFFKQKFKNKNFWNQSVLLKLNEEVNIDMIKIAVKKLVQHHDSLRLNYNGNKKILYYNNEYIKSPIDVTEFDFCKFSIEEQNIKIKEFGEKIKDSFNIEKDMLFKVAIFNLGSRGKHMLITAHHLTVDGVSWRIILEDFNKLLLQVKSGEDLSLPGKTHSVQQWVKELAEYSKGQVINEQQYWNEIIENKFHYPTDYDLGEDNLEFSSTLREELDSYETEQLLTKANLAYGTETNELLITALALTISKLSRTNKVTFELEGHGREEISNKLDISRTVGWFTTMYPVNLNIEETDLSVKIKSIKEQLRSIPKKGFNFQILKYCLGIIKDDDEKHIRFNYLGDFDSTINNSIFKISKENIGRECDKQNHMTCLVEINSMIIDQKLNISITFSKNKFKEETMKEFIDEYLMKIKEILMHCCSKESKEFTPSDFDAADLSQDDLDTLFD